MHMNITGERRQKQIEKITIFLSFHITCSALYFFEWICILTSYANHFLDSVTYLTIRLELRR